MNLDIIKGSILYCLVSSFSTKRRNCVVVEIYYDKNNEIIALDVLPITSKASTKDICICFDCNDDCTKIHLQRDDTTKSFYELSYLFIKKYNISISDCNCSDIIYLHKITKNLQNKLNTFQIYV